MISQGMVSMIEKSKQIMKVGNDMSFVGLHLVDDGIIGFADSKTTRVFDDGSMMEDIKRGRIKKVFKNSKFICVTHGNNELFSTSNQMNIEEYIQEEMKEKTYREFFDELYDKLLMDMPVVNDGKYNFIIGTKDYDKTYHIIECIIDVDNRDIRYHKHYEKQAYFAGEKRYVETYKQIYNYPYLDIYEYSKMIEKSVVKMIELFDLFPGYNTVGIPVEMIVYQ